MATALTSVEVLYIFKFSQLHWVAGDISESPKLNAVPDYIDL